MKEIVRYLVCGVMTTVVSISTFYASTIMIGSNTSLLLQTCNIISFICAVTFAYVVSRFWVFGNNGNHAGKEFLQFVLCRILTLIIDMAVMELLVFHVGVTSLLAKLLVQMIVTILNYLFSKMIFKKGEQHG